MGILFSNCARIVSMHFGKSKAVVLDDPVSSEDDFDSATLLAKGVTECIDKKQDQEHQAPGPRLPAELLIQVLSEVGVTDDGFLWLNCRPVSRAFKDWVEHIYYKEYMPHLQLHTLARADSISTESEARPDDFPMGPDGPASTHSLPSSLTRITDVTTGNLYKRIYKVSSIPHPTSTKVFLELIQPICLATISSEANGAITSFLTSQPIDTNNHSNNARSAQRSISVGELTVNNSFYHFTRATGLLRRPYSGQFVGYYAVRWCKPVKPDDLNDEQPYLTRLLNTRTHRSHGFVSELTAMFDGDDGWGRRSRIDEYHHHEASGHWSFSSAESPASTQSSPSSSLSLPSFLPPVTNKTRDKIWSRSLPIARLDSEDCGVEGEFLEVDWRTLVAHSCRVKETHWLVDWNTNEEYDAPGGTGSSNGHMGGEGEGGRRSGGLGRVKAKRLKMVFWCAYGGLLRKR